MPNKLLVFKLNLNDLKIFTEGVFIFRWRSVLVVPECNYAVLWPEPKVRRETTSCTFLYLVIPTSLQGKVVERWRYFSSEEYIS